MTDALNFTYYICTSRGDYQQARFICLCSSIQSVPSSRSVSDNWLMFKQAVLTAVEKHIPSKMVIDCCRRPPWLNSHANQAIKKRDRLANIAKKSGLMVVRERYRKARNTATNTIQSEYEKSLADIIGNIKTYPRKL